jgi:putative endonuclease
LNKQYFVYILSSQRNGTLYIGSTSNLEKRVWEHKNKVHKGFTQKYSVDQLVYFETYADPEEAVRRERQMKKWNRKWKIRLIEEKNVDWIDLYEKLV